MPIPCKECAYCKKLPDKHRHMIIDTDSFAPGYQCTHPELSTRTILTLIAFQTYHIGGNLLSCPGGKLLVVSQILSLLKKRSE